MTKSLVDSTLAQEESNDLVLKASDPSSAIGSEYGTFGTAISAKHRGKLDIEQSV